MSPDSLIWCSLARMVRCVYRAQGRARSAVQIAVKDHLERAGHGYLVSSDYREVIETLMGGGCCAAASACSETTLVATKCKLLARSNKNCMGCSDMGTSPEGVKQCSGSASPSD